MGRNAWCRFPGRSIALPLTLAGGGAFPARNYILFLTFAVILTTLVIQGLTLPFLIRKLGIKDDGATDEEERVARLAANTAALSYINDLARQGHVAADLVTRLHAEYNDRVQELQACCGNQANPTGEIVTPQYRICSSGLWGSSERRSSIFGTIA